MNLLLFTDADRVADDLIRVPVQRYSQSPGVWPPLCGHHLRVGLVNGPIGSGYVTDTQPGHIDMRVSLHEPPPPPLPLTLLLSLPRPKMLRRVLRSATELGIKRIYLINSTHVDKSYWQSPWLAPEQLRQGLQTGLEQCCDSVFPEVFLRTRFRPFVEDELSAIAETGTRLVAHPRASPGAWATFHAPLTLAIGPEGGFSDFEIGLLAEQGFEAFSLGPRILRVETALPAVVASLFPRQPAH